MGTRADEVSRFGEAHAAVMPADETEQIVVEIEQTRSEMSSTIDAIQERLNPEQLGEQAKDITAQAKEAALEVVQHALQEARVHAREAVHEATEHVREAIHDATIGKVENMVQYVGDTASDTRATMMETIRQNPLPAALVGLGLGWLFMNRASTPARRSTNGRAYRAERFSGYAGGRYGDYGVQYGEYPDRAVYRYGYQGYQGEQQGQPGMMGRAGEAVSNFASQAGETVGSAAGQVGETVGNAASQVGETVGNVASQVGETAGMVASQVGETASNLAGQAQYQAQRLEDRFQSSLQQNPLAVGAMALALGAAVGLALPQTQRENELLGEARDTLVEKAQEVAQDTFGKVQQVAQEAQSAAGEAAQKQGLMAQ